MTVSVNKQWYKSKTVWAAIGALGVAIAGAVLGEASPVVAALVGVLSAFGIYGRAAATSKLTT